VQYFEVHSVFQFNEWAVIFPQVTTHTDRLSCQSKNIHALFDQAHISDKIVTEITTAYTMLDGKNPPVAIRSSANAEDLPELSFAGQQETFLNVCGLDEVTRRIRDVFASLFNDRAI
jgi:pyruvate,water dikinase